MSDEKEKKSIDKLIEKSKKKENRKKRPEKEEEENKNVLEQAKAKEKEKEKQKKNKKKKQKRPEKEKEEGENYKNEENNEEKNRELKKTEQQQQQQLSNNNNKRKRKDVFPYGNYRSYYGYRIGHDMDEDPRLKVLKREWFEGKDCLDVGCNSGIITIQIAKKFRCQSILGIDIDTDRIADAYWHLRKFVRAECVGKPRTKASRLDDAEKVNGSEHRTTVSSVERKEIAGDSSPSDERDLLDVVSFRQENFVQSRRPLDKQFDTILCLSVTKWVHLNWGDDGLITLFSKIWKLLRPGGILVLEPQPWKSYENNRLVSETTAMNFKTIMFRLASFQEILLDKIGFRWAEDITSSLSGCKTGFDRPIFAFHK